MTRAVHYIIFSEITGHDVELGLRHFGRLARLPESDVRAVLAVDVLGEARVHAIVPLVDGRHLQIAVRALPELLHVHVVLDQTVVEQPRDGRVGQRLGHARQVDRRPVPRPHFLDHVRRVHGRELDGQMSVFHPLATLRRTSETVDTRFSHFFDQCLETDGR